MRTRLLVPVVVLSLALVGCGSSSKKSSSTGSTGASASAISIKELTFSPATLNVKVGTTVTVKNDDTPTHTWTADDGSFDEQLSPGASATHTFDKAGTFAYHCKIHSSMKGTVVVS